MTTSPDDGHRRRFAVPSPAVLADRLGVSVGAVVAGLLAVVAAAAGGWWALRPPSGPDPVEMLPMASSVDIPTPTPSRELESILVDVVGAVLRPGLHELPEGSRVADALKAAGGLTAEADRIRLNLAQPLSDGSRLWVPEIGESAGPEVVAVQGAGPDGTASGDAPIDINSADVAALEELPGIGPALAAAILEHRERVGGFATVDDLLGVSGIGPVKLDRLRSHVSVGAS